MLTLTPPAETETCCPPEPLLTETCWPPFETLMLTLPPFWVIVTLPLPELPPWLTWQGCPPVCVTVTEPPPWTVTTQEAHDWPVETIVCLLTCTFVEPLELDFDTRVI